MNQRRNVLIVINLFNSAKSFIGPQFSYLHEQGYKMHLICSPSEQLNEFADKHNIRFKTVELKRQISLWSDLKAFINICRYIKKNKIDTIIGHQAKGRLLSVIAGKIMRVPYIIIFAHGAIFETSKGIKQKMLIWESKFESMCANKVVCVSNYIAQLRQNKHIDKKEKQVILGKGTCGGIDTQRKFNPHLIDKNKLLNLKTKLGIKENDFVIGFSGRIVKDKGIIELIEAFKLLKEKYTNLHIKLVFIGVFEKRDSIPNEYISYIEANPDIIFTGFIEDNIELYYSILSLLILPSYREGFGMSLIEASAMEIPVLASSITGCAEALVNEKTGLYVEITPQSISEKINKLIISDKLRTEMAKNGRKWVVKNFDHHKIWPYINVLLKNN
jgi:glycosyltransferase involved in cell wall biosynthesis